jgi:hypothetical protein
MPTVTVTPTTICLWISIPTAKTNSFIFYGKGGEVETNRLEDKVIYSHVNPYGIFELDMNTRLPIKGAT